MSDYWSALSESGKGAITPDEFAAVAYRLMMEQCIYHADRGSRVAYGLVDRYEREFAKVLAPFGVHLKVNRVLMYAVALPDHPKTTLASKAETLFALVLRSIYEESARLGYISETGEIQCDLIELGEKYRLMTGEDLPTSKSAFDGLMRTAYRWGIARWLEENEMAMGSRETDKGVAIRPAIVDILGETALRRLALWQQAISRDSVAVARQSDPDISEEISNETA